LISERSAGKEERGTEKRGKKTLRHTSSNGNRPMEEVRMAEVGQERGGGGTEKFH